MSAQVPAGTATRPAGTPRRDRAAGPRESIRRHPLTWFFSLAYLLSWAAWIPYILSENGMGAWHFTFPGGSGGSQLLGVLPGAYLGPITSALLVTGVTEGRSGLRAWRRRVTRLRVGPRWYLVVLLSVPAVLTLASTAVTGQGPALPSTAVLAAFLPGLLVQMLTTGLAEEPGWREFAMPRLQLRHGPLRATLVVGPLWGAWHLPLFLTEWGGGPHVPWTTPVEFIATTIAFSTVMTWVFNATGESLPLAMLLHCSVNNYFSLASSDLFPTLSRQDVAHAFLLGSLTAAVVLLVATRGRLGCPPAPATAALASG